VLKETEGVVIESKWTQTELMSTDSDAELVTVNHSTGEICIVEEGSGTDHTTGSGDACIDTDDGW